MAAAEEALLLAPSAGPPPPSRAARRRPGGLWMVVAGACALMAGVGWTSSGRASSSGAGSRLAAFAAFASLRSGADDAAAVVGSPLVKHRSSGGSDDDGGDDGNSGSSRDKHSSDDDDDDDDDDDGNSGSSRSKHGSDDDDDDDASRSSRTTHGSDDDDDDDDDDASGSSRTTHGSDNDDDDDDASGSSRSKRGSDDDDDGDDASGSSRTTHDHSNSSNSSSSSSSSSKHGSADDPATADDDGAVGGKDPTDALSVESSDCGYPAMQLVCMLHLAVDKSSIGDDSLDVSVQYYPKADGEKAALWAAPITVDSSERAWDLTFYRIRPGTEYVANVWAAYEQASDGDDTASPTLVKSFDFSSQYTGIPILDKGQIAFIAAGGSKQPKYEVMMFDLADGDAFEGVVAIDRSGYPVWYYNAFEQVMAFDQFPDYSIGINVFPGGGAYSSLRVIEPSGEYSSKYDDLCTGDGSNWTQVNHEARVTNDGRGLLTVHQHVHAMAPGEEVHVKGEELKWILADKIGYWKVGDAHVTELYNVIDYFDPYRNPVHSPASFTFVHSLECGGPAPVRAAIDWSHMSAISEHGNLIIASLRNINTVVAFWRENDPNAPGIAWVLSSSLGITSSFNFTNDNDKFYNVHDAQMVSDHEIVLIDDGNNRPGCRTNFDDHCYTRAVQYHLDFETMEAALQWEFEWPYLHGNVSLSDIKQNDLFVPDGGSVTYAAKDDLYYVAYTYLNATEPRGKYGYIFEVNKLGAVRTRTEVPRVLWDTIPSGMYRATPYDSIFGEDPSSPFNSTTTAATDDDDGEDDDDGDDARR